MTQLKIEEPKMYLIVDKVYPEGRVFPIDPPRGISYQENMERFPSFLSECLEPFFREGESIKEIHISPNLYHIFACQDKKYYQTTNTINSSLGKVEEIGAFAHYREEGTILESFIIIPVFVDPYCSDKILLKFRDGTVVKEINYIESK